MRPKRAAQKKSGTQSRFPGRAFVVAGVVVGIVTFVLGVAADWNPAAAIPAALAAAALAMIVCGVGRNFWNNRTVNQASFPGGGGVTFEDQTVKTVKRVNERVDQQMEEVNERLYEVEKRTLDPPDSAAEQEE